MPSVPAFALPDHAFAQALPSTLASSSPDAGRQPYPRSILRPTEAEGTGPFLLTIFGLGVVVTLVWRAWCLRASSRPGLPDVPIIPGASPHKQIHDRKYLSRILSDEEEPPAP